MIVAKTGSGFKDRSRRGNEAEIVAPVAAPLPRVSGDARSDAVSQWVVDWWQWALSIPADRSPLTDTTGEFAGENQHGPVWFVAGTFGNSVERSYRVPAGKALFVPVYTWIFGAGAFDCDPSNPGVPCVVCDLEKLAAANTQIADVVEASIDGVPVQNIRRYEADSGGPFAIRYPENSVVGLPAGRYFPNLSDGYWLMVKPLPPGTHEIRLHAHYPGLTYDPYEYTMILHIEVTAPGRVADQQPGSQD